MTELCPRVAQSEPSSLDWRWLHLPKLARRQQTPLRRSVFPSLGIARIDKLWESRKLFSRRGCMRLFTTETDWYHWSKLDVYNLTTYFWLIWLDALLGNIDKILSLSSTKVRPSTDWLTVTGLALVGSLRMRHSGVKCQGEDMTMQGTDYRNWKDKKDGKGQKNSGWSTYGCWLWQFWQARTAKWPPKQVQSTMRFDKKVRTIELRFQVFTSFLFEAPNKRYKKTHKMISMHF